MENQSKILLYQTSDGKVNIDVNLSKNDIWLSQNQMADLFGTKRQAISKHLTNIFLASELNENSVCSILEHTAQDGKSYKTKFYSLDAIISVGYRINSTNATQFRIWATNVLKQHLIKGFTIHEKRMAQQGMSELENALALLQKTLTQQNLTNDIGKEAVNIILEYAKSWKLLLAYDEDQLEIPKHGQSAKKHLEYSTALKMIKTLKNDLMSKGEASDFFGRERDGGLDNVLQNIEQSFADEELYKTVEEKAAHLLYFIIKNHPFIDGNKRIGSFLFLIYLKLQDAPLLINSNGIVSLALLVAESQPSQKPLLIKLITNLLHDKG
jgi:prophage maintenance system killer protein